jgi:hypothetical protein
MQRLCQGLDEIWRVFGRTRDTSKVDTAEPEANSSPQKDAATKV